jgi:hypothetical protein
VPRLLAVFLLLFFFAFAFAPHRPLALLNQLQRGLSAFAAVAAGAHSG